MKTLLAFLILTTTVEAAEHRLDNGIVVSSPVIVTPPLPSFVRALTPGEYRDYALAENRRSVAESLEANASAEREPDRYRDVVEYSGSSQTRFGGGVGYGGFGGAGGYSGYIGLTESPGGYGGFGGYGGGRGNATASSFSSTRAAYTLIYHDRAYKGAPALLLNPWCRPKN
ncbi:MAG TPA: hypothetical protein VG125_09485 [Pirellulales bacterium]|jgi:hypothetical protein|nr:hypothetical protein [Pirellulales bacterium]